MDDVEEPLPPEPTQRIASAALAAWLIGGGASAVGLALAATVAVPVLRKVDGLPGWVPGVVIAAVAVTCVLLAAVIPVVRFRTWRYAVRPEEIDIVHGTFVRTRTVVPMARVQHVETERGPVERALEIATLKIHTAAGEHKIPGLRDAAAAHLRTEIARRARVVDEV